MHPLQRRFLDVAAAMSALEGTSRDADALALVEAVRRDEGLEAKLLASKGRLLSQELQQRLLVATTRAATARLLVDDVMGPPGRAALEGVMAAGASRDEALALVQQVLLETAFGWPDDPSAFDVAFLLETLSTLPALARIDAGTVDDWVDRFVKQVEVKDRPLRVAVAEALLESAWSDGAQPFSAEHVDEALEVLSRSVASQELEHAGRTLVDFLSFLSSEGVVGARRLERLTQVARAAARAPALDDEEADDADEDE